MRLCNSYVKVSFCEYIHAHCCCNVKPQNLYDSFLLNKTERLTFSVLCFFSCGLLSVDIRPEVSSRQLEIRRKSQRVDAVLLRVLLKQIVGSRPFMTGADIDLWCAELLCTPGAGLPITSGEDVVDGEGRKT